MTLFGAQSNARTFDYQGGDIAYVPTPYGHYIENTGNTTLRFLEIFNSGESHLPRSLSCALTYVLFHRSLPRR